MVKSKALYARAANKEVEGALSMDWSNARLSAVKLLPLLLLLSLPTAATAETYIFTGTGGTTGTFVYPAPGVPEPTTWTITDGAAVMTPADGAQTFNTAWGADAGGVALPVAFLNIPNMTDSALPGATGDKLNWSGAGQYVWADGHVGDSGVQEWSMSLAPPAVPSVGYVGGALLTGVMMLAGCRRVRVARK
jgi:prepilin-type processing-associated H-X9-DG protein